jgi:hypothetical protein
MAKPTLVCSWSAKLSEVKYGWAGSAMGASVMT